MSHFIGLANADFYFLASTICFPFVERVLLRYPVLVLYFGWSNGLINFIDWLMIIMAILIICLVLMVWYLNKSW